MEKIEGEQELLSAPVIRLLTDNMVGHFLDRLLLRNPPLRSLTIVTPFMNVMKGCPFTLADLSARICKDATPTYLVTRSPHNLAQQEAIDLLAVNDSVEIRYNPALHAKIFIATAADESESFAVFGSGNLTRAAVNSNLEVGMIVLSRGTSRKLVDELYYWATNTLRVHPDSQIIKRFSPRKI